MKQLTKILFTLLMLFVVDGWGQNLVPNPSFEDYSLCPDNWDQFDRVNNWSTYKQTPDYYNSCDNTNMHSTPSNLMGYQQPHSGNAYAGLIFYEKGGESLNEMIGAQLSLPLVIGTKYYVSLKVILKYNNSFGICCGQDMIGAKFSNQPYTVMNPPQSDNSPHIYSTQVISDTTNWVEVFGSFTADSAYTHISIGNYFSNTNVTINDIIPSNFSSYYYVDDVCVSTDSSYATNYVYTGVDSNPLEEVISIYPNPANDFIKIENHNSTNPISIKLYNSLGQLLLTIDEEHNPTTTIDISDYCTNLIYIVVTSNNKSFTQKLLKL
ncbi:MAG: T9SS type A sorting domain-containing protein [Flavobacteriales bacterium]|nr:T9SS type A sorting domain-containing protein [Flavobacteriales bacterium]